jgi:hypothetical protein
MRIIFPKTVSIGFSVVVSANARVGRRLKSTVRAPVFLILLPPESFVTIIQKTGGKE